MPKKLKKRKFILVNNCEADRQRIKYVRKIYGKGWKLPEKDNLNLERKKCRSHSKGRNKEDGELCKG